MFLASLASVLCAEAAALAPVARAQVVMPQVNPEPDPAAWRQFWDGIDIFDTGDEQENSNRVGRMETSHLTREASPHTNSERAVVGVEVLGLQDTGTNLLVSLLRRNFGSQITFYDSTFGTRQHGVWKHANMGWIDNGNPEAFDNLKINSVIPLVMVRNPLSWLQSIKKAPYELHDCVTGSNWLTKPCTHKYPAGYNKTTHVGPASFKHLSGVWGRWTESYEPILAKHFGEVIILSYEDLVMHTSVTVRDIAAILKLTLPKTIDVVESPAKDHGQAVGHEAALSKIANQEYLAEYSDEELGMVCSQLMYFKDLLIQYNYDDCFFLLNRTTSS